MALKRGIENEWANSSGNMSEPDVTKIGTGVINGTTANSGEFNWWENHQDVNTNAAQRQAQAASSFPPIDGYDRTRLGGELHHSGTYGALLPDSAVCSFDLTGKAPYDATAGWNFSLDEGCVYWVNGYATSVFRGNTNRFGEGASMIETLDLDMTNADTGAYTKTVVSSGDKLILVYGNTVSGNYHIASFDLTGAWTGLPVDDRNTGWAYNPSTEIKICLATPTKVGVFYSTGTAAEFGVWAIDNTSWLTGDGNIDTITAGHTISDSSIQKPQSNGSQLFTILRCSDSSGEFWIVACDISDPTTCSNPTNAANVAYLSGSRPYVGFRMFGSYGFFLHPTSLSYIWYDDSTADWNLQSKTNLSSIDLLQSTTEYCPKMTTDACGRLWLLMRLDSTQTINGSTSLVMVAFDAGAFRSDGPSRDLHPAAVIPLGSYSSAIGDLYHMVFDSQNMVVLDFTSPSLKILTNPGAR